MRTRRSRLLAGGVVLVLIAGAVGAGVWWWRDASRSELSRAVALAPSGIERYSWTDWAGVRAELGTSGLDELLEEGYDADLVSASALVDSAPVLEERYGWSPASVEWELFAQGPEGAVVTLRLADSVSVEDLAERLGSLGYTEPSEDDGVWRGGDEVLARIASGSGVTPALSHLAFDEGERLLRGSDNASYLEGVLDGDGGPDEAVADAVAAAGDALSAAVYTGDHACAALAMSQADEGDQDAADALLDEAGEVSPLRGFVMAVRPDRDLVVAMSFETDDQARTNADTRALLAAGPAPGQGGSFADRFELGDVTADGRVVTMDLAPLDDTAVLSDLSTGPVLFATC